MELLPISIELYFKSLHYARIYKGHKDIEA